MSLILLDPEDEQLRDEYHFYVSRKGYVRTRRKGTSETLGYLHILVLEKHGLRLDGIVDHDNRNKLDNRKTNLRVVTHSVSNHNRSAQVRTDVGQGLPKNVCHSGPRYVNKPYQVQFRFEGRNYFLGRYATVEEADTVAQQFRTEKGLPP
jgi:hypothetical protein